MDTLPDTGNTLAPTHSPAVPVQHRLQRLAGSGLEIRSQRICHRDERRLYHLLIGDAEQFRCLLLEEEMKARQAASQATRPCSQYKAPGSWHNRAPAGGLGDDRLMIGAALNTRNHMDGNFVQVINQVLPGVEHPGKGSRFLL